MENPVALTKQAIAELVDKYSQSPAVTIYLPTHRAATPPNMSEDQIRCKNLINKAIDKLKSRADGRQLAEQLTTDLQALLSDINFWENQTEGLLLCATPTTRRAYHLPIDTEEYVAVGDRFHLAPIFGLLQDMPEYYVLVVAQHEPVIFKGSSFDLQATDIDLPMSVKAGLNIDEVSLKSEQQRSAEGSNSNNGGYNGRGGAKNPAEDERQRFWRLLDQIICEKANTKLPLMLAGVENELSEYRAISHYPKIMQHSIDGSYSGVKPHELFAQANAAAQAELVKAAHERVVAEYQRAKGQTAAQAANNITAIGTAAEQGRVDKLLLADVRFTTDTVRDNTQPVSVLSFPQDGSADTIQEIAYGVWSSGGQIANIEAEQMPEQGALVLATLRY